MFVASRITALSRGSAFTGLARSSKLGIHARSIVTVKATPAEENSILVAQRKNRPCSPHLTIYEMQLTAVMSSFHRITGVGLATGLYAVTVGYATGIIDTASLLDFYTSLPGWAHVAFKAVASFPFAFHAWNGVRHLIWDSGREADIKGVYKTGYAVLGLTAVSALALLLV
jgi:succinate dehydrogenase (ubiquinone) cytochrome b560 subunit